MAILGTSQSGKAARRNRSPDQNGNGLRTWIEIDRKAIRQNFDVFKSLISSSGTNPRLNSPKSRIDNRVKLMAVVKSNAYGHGLLDFSKEMEKLGADFLGVDSMTEARALRREGIKTPILVLGYTLPELFREAAENNISLTVSSFETLAAIKKAKLPKPLKIHIKVDTGMHRQGFLIHDLGKVVKILDSRFMNHGSFSTLCVEGLYTHFANAKNPAFPQDTKAQIAEFEEWIAEFKKAGLKPIAHAAATAGTLLFRESHFDMVRIGIGLYGLWPAKEAKAYLGGKIKLAPVLSWKAFITEIKMLPKGSRIGYDFTETLGRDSTVAIIPVGYWHGYPRSLSSIGCILVNGKELKVLGRVSMDMLTIDITGARGAKVGDEAIILGQDSISPASAEGTAALMDSSWYEIVTCLNPLIKRLYVN